MAIDIYINTDRAIERSIVSGVNQPTKETSLKTIISGTDTDVLLYYVKSNGTYDSRSGVAGSTPRISVTLKDKEPVSGTFTVGDGTDTTSELRYDISAAGLQSALNGLNTNTGPFGDTVTVREFATGVYSVLFDSNGAQTELTVTATNIQPVSTASVLPIVTGTASVRAQQLIRIIASPLVFQDINSLITNGWAMEIDANNANMLYALASAQGNIEAEITFDVLNATSEVEVLARKPITLKRENFDIASLSGLTYSQIASTENVVNQRVDITRLTGGTSIDLDSIITTTLNIGYTVFTGVTISATVPGKVWVLTSGTSAEDAPGGIVRPDDYAASTNERYWQVQL